MSVLIRALDHSDFSNWQVLWDANNLGQKNEAVTQETWRRLMDPDAQVFGLGAFQGDEMVGLVHYILHPTTGHIAPVCYMQDVFVDPAHRNKGIGRSLVEAVAKIGQQENWARLYWLAEAKNEAAQALYKSLGLKLDFTLHVLPLGKIL